ncbi:Keratin [Fimbriiglobus ruber]|uniref:Keratin n=2 Tax=Fimbriiglobus ruber TaxID=1908690 RepID=A0A225DGE3_9BACT|nr:Keratin [Fimbriiglobus ruber]
MGSAPIMGAPAVMGDTIPGGSYPSGPPATIAPPTPAIPSEVRDSPYYQSGYARAGGAMGRATVVVRLPADARLYAEGRLLSLASTERTFVSPPLPGGLDFTYTFRAEYVRDGETITRSKRIAIRAGTASLVEFADGTQASAAPVSKEPVDLASKTVSVPVHPAPSVDGNTASKTPTNPFTTPSVGDLTGKPTTPFPPIVRPAVNTPERARITVKLPSGTTLFVDGKKNERTDLVREFNTPPLPQGQEFAYLMRAETTRDGRPEYQVTKVTFRAGEIVTVDFTSR